MNETPALEATHGTEGRSRLRPSRTVLVTIAIVAIAAIAIAAVLLANSSSGSSELIGARPSQIGKNRQQAQYTAGVPSVWPQYKSDERVGGYLESAWHDPAAWVTTFVADSTRSVGAGSPMAAAQLARVQAHLLPGFHERNLKAITLRGLPAVSFAFDAAGKSRLDYFFEECGTSFVTQGSSPVGTMTSFGQDFHGMAYSIEARCDE